MSEPLIRNRAFMMQIKDYSGLKFDRITPTDIDGFIDFGNKLFVFIECKHGNAPLPYGQRLALERLTDATSSPPARESMCIIASHESDGDISVADAIVRKIRWRGVWHDRREQTVRQVIDRTLESLRTA